MAPAPQGPQAQAWQCAWVALVDSLPEATWVVEGGSLRVVAANAAAHVLLGRESGTLLGERADALVLTPEDMAYWDDAAAGRAGVLQSEASVHLAGGRTVHVERSIRPFVPPGATATFHTVVLQDLTERQRSEDQREQALAELQATLESTADGILVTDLAGRIRVFNQRFAQLWAIPSDLLVTRQDEAVHAWLRRSVHDGEAYQARLQAIAEAALLSATDELTLHSGKVLQRVTQPLWYRGQPMGRVYSFRDQSQRIAADRRIIELSHTDALTGLPNRAELAAAVEAAGAPPYSPTDQFALMLVDLDRFRAINDSLGTTMGDHVLTDVTRRIRGCMRQGDVLARVGGDQFVLLIHRCDAEADDDTGRDSVSLRRRVWPMVQMLERAHAASEPIVWGV
jgi:diguanylate cyclase (GGDEF)-like protein